MGHPSARSLPRTYVPSASSGQALGYCLPPLRGWSHFHRVYPRLAPWAAFFRRFAAAGATDRREVKIPNRHASVPRIGMLRLRSRFVTRAGKPGSGEGQNTNGLRVVESHFSQRTREMGHPAAVESTQDLRPFGKLRAGSGHCLRPSGAGPIFIGYTHGLRRGLHSFAASRLRARPIGGKSKSPPSRLRAADRDASTALPVCHSRRETGERRGSKYQWVEGCGIPLLAKDARNGAAGGSGGAGRKAGPSTPRERPADDHAPLGMTNQLG
jgi:hypothetical protein